MELNDSFNRGENFNNETSVDDLIIKYLTFKTKEGYEPNFYGLEFIEFLNYYTKTRKVTGFIYDKDLLFEKFYKHKFMTDWITEDNKVKPQVDMLFDDEKKDYFIKANYNLILNQKTKVNNNDEELFNKFLENFPKREIDENILLDDVKLNIGKYVTNIIIENIWTAYFKDLDLSYIETIAIQNKLKKDLLELYSIVPSKIAILYEIDNSLKLSSNPNNVLANANYNLVTKGYEDLLKIAYTEDKKQFDFDLEKFVFSKYNEKIKQRKR